MASQGCTHKTEWGNPSSSLQSAASLANWGGSECSGWGWQHRLRPREKADDLWAIHRTVEVYVTLLCILNSPLPYSYEAGILENPKVSPLPRSQLPVVVPSAHAI